MESRAPEQGSSPPNDQLSAVKVAFPQTPEDFENDPRVAFSKLENKWLLEDDDGQEFEWMESVKKWTPVLDDALREQQQKAYAGAQEAGSADSNTDNPPTQSSGAKRKGDQQAGGPPKKSKNPPQEKHNSAVYVTSIPLDANVEEIAHVFGRCGMIAEGTDNSSKRIKMYTDKNGKFQGEALVVFFRPESVALAVQMLDDSDFRLGVKGPGGPMRVSEADRNFKKQQDNQEDPKKDSTDAEMNFRKKRPTNQQKQVKAKTQKMNNKLADWSSDEDVSALPQTNPRFDKVVVLYHMFTLAEIDEDPKALDDIREDIQEEAEKLGQVMNITLFDKEPRGVVTIRFMDPTAARECVKLMDGRHFDGRTVVAEIATGNERFKKSRAQKDPADDDQEGNRIDEFGQWLEKEA